MESEMYNDQIKNKGLFYIDYYFYDSRKAPLVRSVRLFGVGVVVQNFGPDAPMLSSLFVYP